ncbi:MAG: cryptochrome/photolyase family protein [Aquificaceae bacterium]|jgi:deoxyribodipyrimidine photo-lyase|uniref:cryptochrome/photolyase family protein n=1 Tax=Hydrogenobacter sp. Uz 6-8 TaxID=3384828 RepID=UPI0030A33B89
MRAVYLFKRDLRVKDNRGLALASKNHREIVPVFIFDRDILTTLKVDYKRLGYLVRAVALLSSQIRLYCLQASTEEALREVFRVAKPTHLYTTVSYSWSGVERNREIRKLCREYGVEYVEVFDNFLAVPEAIPQRKVYTPFYTEWTKKVDLSETSPENFTVPQLPLPALKDLNLDYSDPYPFYPEDCEKRLSTFPFEKYEELRNYPAVDGSSRLSPCIRFGVLSLREIYKRAHLRSEQFIKELAWREFWYHIALNFPQSRDLEFQVKRRNIKWENRKEHIRAFFEARTGYPIVDAGIRQLVEEKWLHNRMRMIVGSFLTKVLLVDWRIGEKFFMEHLLDYDEVVNTGNWQWTASVGADPKPFRLFNPILQAQRYDPDCAYIKTYLPELSKVPCHMLHDPLSHRLPYHRPIVNYYERIKLAKEAYGQKG